MMNFRDPQTIVEQLAILFASFVWTTIVLVGIMFFWAYQDVQARWESVMTTPPGALAQALPEATPSPTVTVWAGPGPTLTPSPTSPPTPIPTRVIEMPSLLPETLNPGETSVPVDVHAQDQAPQVEPTRSQGVVIHIRPTETATPPASNSQPPSAAAQPAVVNNVPSDGFPAGVLPTRLVINSIGLDSKIIPVGWSIIQKDGYEYSIWQVADYAVGWHKTTAGLGKPGNTVMAGHHNVNGEVFRDLVNVEVGDKVTVFSEGQQYNYIVELKTIVKEKGEPVDIRKQNAKWISPTEDERLTFVTCWPYTNNTHRVIVVAKPI